MRVLVAPGMYTAFPGTDDEFTTDNGADAGILGGDPNAQVDDFEWTFNIENGRLVGTVSGLTDSHCNNGDCEDIQVSNPPPVDVDLPALCSICVNGVCAVLDGTLTQDGEATTYVGLAVLKQDFFAYHLLSTSLRKVTKTIIPNLSWLLEAPATISGRRAARPTPFS